jgi:hypothetical protein
MKTPASLAPTARRIRLEQQAAALVRNCPVDGTNPDCCPLCELRVQPLAKRKTWLENLTDEELHYLLTYHATCAAERNRALGFARGPARTLAGWV